MLLALIVAVPLSIVALTDTVSAAGSPAPAPVTAPVPGAPAPGAASGDMAATVTVIALIVGLLVIVGVGVKMFDLKRKRQAEAVQLQAQLSDALLREGSMSITPTAHVPLWAGGPVTVELSGPGPSSPEGREAALQLVEREAARIRPDVRVIDRLRRAA
ncbi:MAG TPA: hypothetical protein VMR23_15605 [Candidatus Limnocylindria bacterium]|nr:hypothetical protein [Candidatus Limnocylindria bacterium]